MSRGSDEGSSCVWYAGGGDARGSRYFELDCELVRDEDGFSRLTTTKDAGVDDREGRGVMDGVKDEGVGDRYGRRLAGADRCSLSGIVLDMGLKSLTAL